MVDNQEYQASMDDLHQARLNNLIEEARSWIGTKWGHNQAKKGVAVDCVNFLFHIAHDSGLNIPLMPTKYTKTPINNEIENYLITNSDYFKPVLEYQKGCVLLITNPDGRRGHIGLVTGLDTLIHATLDKGVIEQKIDDLLKRKIHKIWLIQFPQE